MKVDIEHEVFIMLNFQNDICIKSKGYNRDSCEKVILEKNALEEYGCTTPFGSNKDQICKDIKNATKVLNNYRDTNILFTLCYHKLHFWSKMKDFSPQKSP